MSEENVPFARAAVFKGPHSNLANPRIGLRAGRCRFRLFSPVLVLLGIIRLLFARRREGSMGIQHFQDFGHGRFESQIAEEQGWAWRLLLGLEDLLGSFGIHFRRGARCTAAP